MNIPQAIVKNNRTYNTISIENRKKDKSVGMDSLPLFRRGPALYCRNGVVTSSLYADGAVRCRSYVLHIMALSALGYQTLVESLP